MARTVITIPGAFSIYNTSNFGGALFASPNTRISSPSGGWNNWTISDAAATEDMNDLDDLMHTHIASSASLPIVVAGHSRGGQVIYKWLREIGPTSDIDPADVLFISSGNPERKYNGASYVNPAGKPAVYPGTGGAGVGYGLPSTPTAYTVIDIARQYDEWADYPNVYTNKRAMAAVKNNGIHVKYPNNTPNIAADGSYTASQWAVFTEGNVTYLTAPTYPMPNADETVGREWNKGFLYWTRVFGGFFLPMFRRAYVTKETAVGARAAVEAAYTRPAAVPVPQEFK